MKSDYCNKCFRNSVTAVLSDWGKHHKVFPQTEIISGQSILFKKMTEITLY